MNNITLDTVTNNSSNLEKEEKKKMENKQELSGAVIDKNISNNSKNDMVKGNLKKNKNELFNFEADHNGVRCIESLKEEDKGTERQYRFTAKMLAEIFDVADRTLRDNIESLVEDRELTDCGIPQSVVMADSKGRLCVNTNIYNLEVLNKLGMCCFRRNKKAKEIRNKFNDVLVKHETSPENNMLPKDYIAALEALLKSEKEKLAMKQEIDNLKAEAGVLSQDYVSNKDVFSQLPIA